MTRAGTILFAHNNGQQGRVSKPINPEPEDFAAVERAAGPLPAENGSPAAALIRYEVAQAHKLVRLFQYTAQRIRQSGD